MLIQNQRKWISCHGACVSQKYIYFKIKPITHISTIHLNPSDHLIFHYKCETHINSESKTVKTGKHDVNALHPIHIQLTLRCKQLTMIFLWLNRITLCAPVVPDENNKIASLALLVCIALYIFVSHLIGKREILKNF